MSHEQAMDKIAEQLRALGLTVDVAPTDPGPPPTIYVDGVEIGTIHPETWDGKLDFKTIREERIARTLAAPFEGVVIVGPLRGMKCRTCGGKGLVDLTISSHFDATLGVVLVDTTAHLCQRCQGLGAAI